MMELPHSTTEIKEFAFFLISNYHYTMRAMLLEGMQGRGKVKYIVQFILCHLLAMG